MTENNYFRENNFISNKKITDIRPGDKNIEIQIILLNFVSRNTLKSDIKITQFLVADAYGSILCNFFEEVGDSLAEGDILFLKSAYATIFKNVLILYTSKPGLGQIVKLGEYFMTFNETTNMSILPWRKEKDEKTGMDIFVLDNYNNNNNNTNIK